MIVTIIGAKREMGNYQGRDYDNVKIRCTYPATGDAVEKALEFGDRVVEYKAKSTMLPLEKAYEYMVNKTPLEIYFDQYQNPALITPVKIK